MFRPQWSTKASTKDFKRKWAAMEAKGSKKRSSRARMKAEKENLETAIYHFKFPNIHKLGHGSNSIRRIRSPDNLSTDISELLQIESVKEAYRASNRVEYERQMLWYNDRHTRIANMVQTLEHLALSQIFDHDTASVLGMQTQNERLLSTSVASHRERDPEIRQHTFRGSSRCILQNQVPEWKQ